MLGDAWVCCKCDCVNNMKEYFCLLIFFDKNVSYHVLIMYKKQMSAHGPAQPGLPRPGSFLMIGLCWQGTVGQNLVSDIELSASK